MSATTKPTPETELTPELIERVMKLSPESKDKLLELLEDELLPPDTRTEEEIAALIKQRLDAIETGEIQLMTREESDAAIRAKMRELGVELP